ncbi:MAG: 2'-5' RNA ligase [Chloroflexi bacterium RBG_16_54_18]|nr:MAG: 2'-5' RNA ligase [Chloroflexi bacterium RBG_16_54_18]
MAEIRAFIAVSLPPVLQSQLDTISRQLREMLPAVPIRWVPIKNIHLTLKFLGNIPEQNLGALKESLKAEASRHHAFELNLGLPGAFPSINRPRVIWVGVSAVEELKELARGIENQTKSLGYPNEERPFSPHLTLGRVGQQVSPSDIRLVADAVQSLKMEAAGPTRVTEIHLYRSDLNPAGAVYTRLHSVPLR